MTVPRLEQPPRFLGGAGLAPQVMCVLLALTGDSLRYPAIIAGGAYAATILSFLGGMWWMQALRRSESRWGSYVLAVMPSLVAWAALVPWLVGMVSPRASLILLGVALLISPLGDRAVGSLTEDVPSWRRLRYLLSGGLGGLTLILSALAK